MSSKTKSAQDWEWREGEGQADFSVPDDQTWKQMVIDDLCGGKYEVNGAAVLNKLLLDFYHYLNTPALVKYLIDKCLLTDGERWALTEKPLGPQEKTLHLQQILMKKGENALMEFYQCLLESCGLEPGLTEHYTLVQIIKKKVRFHDCSDMAELLQQEREPVQVVRQIKVVPISSETARSLIQKLHLEECNIDIGKITTQDIAKHWLATDKTKDWKVLVEALLTERGCGCSVSGVLPLSESNPPEVWHFVRSLNQNWAHFAEFLGFPSRLICDIQSAWHHDPKAQIKSFMRMNLIPDCGDEKIRAIIHQITPHMPVCRDPSISTKVKRNINEDEKEDLPSEIRPPTFDGWGAAQGPVVVWQFEDFLKGIKQQKHTGASRVYQGGAALFTGSRSDLYADDETVFTKDNSARYDTPHSARGQETAGESDSKPQDMKASELTVSKQQSLDVHSASEDESGRDILQACIHGSWDFVKQSVSPMSNLEPRNKNGRTALHICCIKENTEIVILLLQNGADVTTVDNEGNCCLHFRETLKNEALVEVLVEEFKKKNTTLDLLNKNGLTPLMVACLTNSDLCTKSAIHLLTGGAAIDGPPDVDSVPLIHASAVGNKWMVETLLLYGANINKQDQDGSTALIQVCLCNHTDIAEKLLEAGADVNKAERNGTAALAAAITRNSFEMVEKLLEKGANPNAIRLISGEVEETPLAFTCSHGLRDIAQLLIVHGAKVNYMCSRQVPAIGFAIIGRQQGMVDFMLQVEDFNKSVYGLAIPMNVAMSVDNLEAAKAVLDVLGGPQNALELAQEKNHEQFKQDISLFIAVGGDALMTSQRQPTAHSFESEARNQRVKVQQTLQTFSQICMSAIMANRDHDFIVEYASADNLPHVAMFFRDYFDRPQRPDVLKANFLSRDHGISPLNFSIERNIINSDDFQVHALEFFPESPDQFYSDLVWSFHQISGGEDLSWDVPSVLQRLFSGSFSLNVDSSMADTHTQTQDFPDANQTPSPMSGATAHRQPHMAASEPMSTASLPSTLSSTTYDAARMVQSHNPVRSSSNMQSALAHTHLQTQQNFSDANHTPSPISWTTANAQLFTTSLPMSNASQPSTLINTTYDVNQTLSQIPSTAARSQPPVTSARPMSAASPPSTLFNDVHQTPSPVTRATTNREPHMSSPMPMSTAFQPPTQSRTTYGVNGTVSSVPMGAAHDQPRVTSALPMSTAYQPPTPFSTSCDAHQTPIQISRTTAYSEPHTTSSLPLFIESQLPTTLNTTYEELSPIPRTTEYQPHMTSALPISTASQPPTLFSTTYGADQTLSSIPVATCSVPMSTALQAPITTLSNTTYGDLPTIEGELRQPTSRQLSLPASDTESTGAEVNRRLRFQETPKQIGSPSRIPVPKRLLSDPQHNRSSSPSRLKACAYTPSPKTEKKIFEFTSQRRSSSIPHSHSLRKQRIKLSVQTAVHEKPTSTPTRGRGRQTHSLCNSGKHSSQTLKRANLIGSPSRIPGPLLKRPLSDPQNGRISSPSEPQASAYTPSPKTEKKIYDFRRSSYVPDLECQPEHSTKLYRQTAIVEETSFTPKWRMHTRSLPNSSSLHKDSSRTPKRANTLGAMRSDDGLQEPNDPLTICGSTILSKPISDIEDRFRELSSCKDSELNWRRLARSLFLTPAEMDRIECFREEERCYQMLCYWKIRFNEQETTYSTLARALVHSNQESIIKKYPQVFNEM